MNFKRKLVSIFGTIAIGLSFSFALINNSKPSSQAVKAEESNTSIRCGVEAEWVEWSDPTSLPADGYHYLLTDVNISSFSLSPFGCYLDLNGKTITFENANGEEAITINHNSKFNLYDSVGEGKITKDSNVTSLRAVSITRNSEFNMYGGTITGFSTTNECGGVYIDNFGTFNMHGGCIDNCFTERNGGGVLVKESATFNMFGGTIQNCTSYSGGGVYSYGIFNMYEGTIQNCTSSYKGGGVYINRSSTFNMLGGTIQNCTSHSGGGVYSYGTFNMHEGTIQNCTCNTHGGGVYLSSGTFNLNGGTIQNCTAGENGGGVFLNSTLIIDGGYIGKNQSEIGSGIARFTLGTFTLKSGRFYTKNTNYDISINGSSTITFDPNGGEGDISPLVATWNSTITETVSVPTREHYYFDGYYNAKEGGDKYFDSYGRVVERTDEGFEWDYVGPVTLYAHWIGDPYTITFDSQGGSGGSTSVVANYDGNMPEAEMPTKEGYIFLGFFDNILNGNQYYNADGSSARKWDKTSDATLYAQWRSLLENFAYQFIELTDGFCTASKDSVKTTLKESFILLPNTDKQTFINTIPEIGRTDFADDEIVLNAKSRYCYMISDHGYDDFLEIFDDAELKALMHRDSIVSLLNEGEDSTSIILVASLSILAITTFSAYILFRKRKEE